MTQSTVGKKVFILSIDGFNPVVQEGESCDLVGQFKLGIVDVDKGQLANVFFTLYDEETGTIINGRNRVSILDENGGQISDGGELRLTLGPADNIIVDAALVPGDLEVHTARIEWEWVDPVQRTGIQEYKFSVEKLVTPTP